MRVYSILLFLLIGQGLYANDFLNAKDIEAVSSESDLDKFAHETFLPISSTYKGKEKSCRYTRFPEEYTQDFKYGQKYDKLKKYYDLKSKVDRLKSLLRPEDDPEYVRRKKDYDRSLEGFNRTYSETLEKMPMDKVRNKELKGLLQDPEKFRKHLVTAKEKAFMFFPNESPQVMDVLFDVIRSNEATIQDNIHAHDHFVDYADSIEKYAEKNRKEYNYEYPRLKEMEKDKALLELAKEIPKEKLEEMFRNQEKYKRSKKLTILFEGTGQYSPKLERNLKVMQTKLGMNASPEAIKAATDKAIAISDDRSYFATKGKVSTWSGTIRGPISRGLYARNKGEVNLRNSQWLYLPSENDAELSSLMNLGNKTDMMDRDEAYHRGIECVKKYLEAYPDTELNLLGHSSGVKAAIDFAEELKKKGIKNKLDVLGIDPVNNMLNGALEGSISGAFVRLDKIGNALTPDCWKTLEQKRIAGAKKYVGIIRSREQDALYKPSNTDRFTTFYQEQDMEGLEIPVIEFGIHGSPVKGADNNFIRFKNENHKHHGAITLEPKVVSSFRSMLAR